MSSCNNDGSTPIPTLEGATVSVGIQTDFGELVCDIFCDRAPTTAAYFLLDVDTGVFRGSSIFRIVAPINAQAGQTLQVVQFGQCELRPDIPAVISHETTKSSGLHHRRGTLSLARYAPGAVYHSAFICVADAPELDFDGDRHPDGQGFAAFGQVRDGWAVLDALHAQAETSDYLSNPIRLIDIYRLS